MDEKDTSFDYVKCCYGQIIILKLADGVLFNASRVLSLFGQGRIYIRTKDYITRPTELSDPESSEKYTPPGSSVSNKASKLRKQSTVSFKEDANDGPSTSQTNDEIQQLKEMFPNSRDEDLNDAQRCFRSLDKAVFWVTDLET